MAEPLFKVYMENNTTRNAFYKVTVEPDGDRFALVVYWGKLKTPGQKKVKSRSANQQTLVNKATALVEAKEARHYVQKIELKKEKGSSIIREAPSTKVKEGFERFMLMEIE